MPYALALSQRRRKRVIAATWSYDTISHPGALDACPTLTLRPQGGEFTQHSPRFHRVITSTDPFEVDFPLGYDDEWEDDWEEEEEEERSS